ncbi:MAG: Rpn family recombination-promoting nuclease/putative transposase [Leadbetterella sp.]|nr:Rpn family recombination-promoting nuclease/putative transposase [Leadbetterella sp.]
MEPIIPILYYHGNKPWDFKPLNACFSDYADLMQIYLPSFATEFVNLQEVSHEQILALTHGLLKSTILYQKYYFDSEKLKVHFQTILENLTPYLGLNITYSIFVYILQGPHLDSKFIKESFENLPDDMRSRITAYDELMAEGIQKGKEQGLTEGLAKLEKSMVQIVLNAYDAGIKPATIRTITGESEEKINYILKQNNRIR